MDPPQDQAAASPTAVVSPSPDILSPGGKSRYGRTHRPKISHDFYNIDDVVIDENPPSRHSPVKSPKLKPPPKSPIIHRELVFELKDEFTKLDDLGMKMANNFKTNLQRGLDDTIKERKFFKSMPENKLEVPNVVDVTKVLKLISTKPAVISEVYETKTPPRAALKTYSNKRKHVHDSDSCVVESFGLPDEPIITVKSPAPLERDTKIDIDMSCEVDVNLTNPWSFDDFPSIPLYASDPITTMEEINFTKSGVLDLFSCDSLLSENDLTSCCEDISFKKLVVTPTIATVKDNNKTIQCNNKSDEEFKKQEHDLPFTKRVLRSDIPKVTENDKHVVEVIHSVAENVKNDTNINESVNIETDKTISKDKKVTKEVKKIKVVKKRVGVARRKIRIRNRPPKRILRSRIDNNNVESSSDSSGRDSPPNISQKSLRSSNVNKSQSTTPKLNPKTQVINPVKTKMPTLVSEVPTTLFPNVKSDTVAPLLPKIPSLALLKAKSQVINPVKTSKVICSPQIRVILNPLACINQLLEKKTLVPNPFKIKSQKARLKRKLKLRSVKVYTNSISETVVESPIKALKKNERGRSVQSLQNVKVKAEEFDIRNIKTEIIDFEVGDLTWAKIGSHPYWPCMITQEPISGDHKKLVGNRTQPLYHVRFFGDKGRRSWVSSKQVMLYYERDDLERLAKVLRAENRVKNSYIKKAFAVRPSKMAKWMSGVKEIDSLKYRTVAERLNYFFEKFASNREKQENERNKNDPKQSLEVKNEETSPVKSRKRTQTSESGSRAKKLKINSDDEDTKHETVGIVTKKEKNDMEDMQQEKKISGGSGDKSPTKKVEPAQASPRKKSTKNRELQEITGTILSPEGSKKVRKKSDFSKDDTETVSHKPAEAILSPEGTKKVGRKSVFTEVAKTISDEATEAIVSPEGSKKLRKKSVVNKEVSESPGARKKVLKQPQPTEENFETTKSLQGRKKAVKELLPKDEILEIVNTGEQKEVEKKSELPKIVASPKRRKSFAQKLQSNEESPQIVTTLRKQRKTISEDKEECVEEIASPDGAKKVAQKPQSTEDNGESFLSPGRKKKATSDESQRRKTRKHLTAEDSIDDIQPQETKESQLTDIVIDDDLSLNRGLKESETAKEINNVEIRKSQSIEEIEPAVTCETNEELHKKAGKKSQSVEETGNESQTLKKFQKKEELSEEVLEARKKLRNSQIKDEIALKDSPDVRNKKGKRNSTEEIAQQETNVSEEHVVPKLRNKRHQIQGEYSNSDTDSKFSDNSSVPASLESQAALYRRNNIFRGVSRDKVCQICEKNMDVFKCKGPCNGVYHYDCAMSETKKEGGEVIEKKSETDPEKDKNNVEIIAMNSKKPLPNLSTSPNFKGMSLAEKIDFRMKEIMKKFDYQSVYSESTDSSSEEFIMDESFDKLKSPSKLSLTVTAKPTNKEVPIIKHVTADNISYICVTNERPKEKEVGEPVKDTLKHLKCSWCSSDETPLCLVCNKEESKVGSKFRQKCSLHQCGKYYHPECLKTWPQTQWSLIQSTKDKKSDAKYDTFVCPRHVCHTCISDDPRAANSRCPSDKVVKCLRCPATYHSSNYCVPAGTHILSSSQIVCPRHYSRQKSAKKRKLQQTINTNWCFICSKGGNLICCETCPTSVHVECLPGDLNEDDTFFCEDCQSGRLPLYDEIVWVKLGTFRWWPALILFPNEVPDNVRHIAHNKGEFVVKFFGTYDHYWVGRGRTFLFQEGDKGHSHSARKRVDNAFVKAIEEAAAAHHLKKQFKTSKVAEKNSGLKPPPYIRIKVNKPVGNVRQFDGNTSNTTSCDCDPNQPHPCGPDSDCLNRLLLTECNPEVCPAGDRCNNQCFEKREYPPLVPHRTQVRGWGLKTLAPIRKGQFVIEYVGEMIDEQEYQRRIQKMHEQKEENYYFLTIDNHRTLDAGPKGNVARFMNHSCQPNCETQKWTVNGDTRVGLFAKWDIPADTELTFNYNLECIGKEKKMCKCGAPNCSGFIGVKVKQDGNQKKPTKPKKKKTPPPLEIVVNENPCFVCGKVGDVGACNNKICAKYYHLQCAGMNSWPEGGKWVCQWHNCNICSKRTIRCCVKCVNSYCPSHSEGNVRYDKLMGFVCTEHDPTKEPIETNEVLKTDDNVTTEESAVTSTTSEDAVKAPEGDDHKDVLDSMSLVMRLSGCAASTPLKRPKEDSSQDESTVSSASASDAKPPSKRRKQKAKRKNKAKTPVEDKIQMKNTANLYNAMQNEVKLSKFTPVKYLRTSRNSMKVESRTDPEKDLPIRKRTRLRCGNTV